MKKDDSIAMRALRRARRAAINFRRAHGVDETAVGGGAARLHGAPVAGSVDAIRFVRLCHFETRVLRSRLLQY